MDRLNNEQRMYPQMKTVLNHLKSGRTITARQADVMYGIGRAAGVVFRLKRAGCPVQKREIYVRNRRGLRVRVAEYFLDQGGSE